MTDELPAAIEDEVLIGRIAGGDEPAFTALFRRRHDDVYRVALMITGMPATAEDIAQEVFLAVMREAARYETGRATVKAWLCGIARNHARRRLSGDGRIEQLPDESDEPVAAMSIEPDPLAELVKDQDLGRLRAAILTLPVRYREVIVLCDLEEITYAEAAAALDCAVGTVRSRLHRARVLLAAKLRGRLAAANASADRISRCLA